MLKFYFNRKAFESFAKELRRASWGIAVATAAANGIHWEDNSGLLLACGGIAWAALQAIAVALDSITNEEGNRK